MRTLRFIAALLLLLLAAALPGPAQAESIQDLFQQANERYWQEDYAGAQKRYHRLVEDFRVDNAEVYYNLANTYAKTERLGAAVLYYKRALRSGPSDKTAEASAWNLDRVRTALVTQHRQQIDQNRMLFDESHGAWYALFHLLPEPALAVATLAFWLLLVGLLVARRFRPLRFVKATGTALLVLTLLFGGLLAGNAATTHTVRLGIILHDNARIRATKAPDAPAVALPEGLEVQLLDEADENLVRIQLSNGREGWVEAEAVKEI